MTHEPVLKTLRSLCCQVYVANAIGINFEVY